MFRGAVVRPVLPEESEVVHFRPAHHFPPAVNVCRPLELVVEVVCVFPYIKDQYGHETFTEWGILQTHIHMYTHIRRERERERERFTHIPGSV